VKRWALLTIGLYAALVFLLSAPLIFLLAPMNTLRETLTSWAYVNAVCLPVLLLAQLVLLLVPVDLSRERPVPRRKIVVSAIVGGLLMCLLAGLFLFSVCLMIWGENDIDKPWFYWLWLAFTVASWLGWGVWFYRSYKIADAGAHVTTISHWLLRGSILEMIVAIPSHIISRNRNDCCAPAITFLGIMMGLSVAVLSFGPGVFFLFANRIRHKQIGRTHTEV